MTTVATEATYLRVRPKGLIDRQKQITTGIILDLDEDGAAVGVEILGDQDMTAALIAVLDKARF